MATAQFLNHFVDALRIPPRLRPSPLLFLLDLPGTGLGERSQRALSGFGKTVRSERHNSISSSVATWRSHDPCPARAAVLADYGENKKARRTAEHGWHQRRHAPIKAH